jgi:hypothetical protein
VRRLGAAAALLVGVAAAGCGGAGWTGYPFVGTASLDVENDELSLRFIDEIEGFLVEADDSDPFFAWGDVYVQSLRNLDPNENEVFDGMTPGWWDLRIEWSDGYVTELYDVHLDAGDVENVEVMH